MVGAAADLADLGNLSAEAVAADLDILYIEVGDQLRSQYLVVRKAAPWAVAVVAAVAEFRRASGHCCLRPGMTKSLRTSSMLAEESSVLAEGCDKKMKRRLSRSRRT